MASDTLGKVDEHIKGRPEVKILVYFALILSLAAAPYTFVVYRAHWLSPAVHECLQEAICAFAALGALFLMRYTPNSLPLSTHGLRLQGIVTQTATGAAIGLALMSAVMNILRVTGHYFVDRQNLAFVPWTPAVLYLFVAIFEETVFRGYIFATLEQKWGSFVGLTSTSLLFGLAHLVDNVPGLNFAHHLRAALFISFEAGLLLNAAFMLTRSLWLGIGIHWAWNFFEGPFYGASVSGTDDPTKSMYIAHTIGRSIITGGSFGPEAGIVCLFLGTFAGLWMLRMAIRSGQWHRNPELETGAEAES